MLGIARPVAFLPSTDLVRAERFFSVVVGLTVLSRSDFACVLDLGGVTLRVTKVDELHPRPFTALGWVVADVRAELSRLHSHGVTALRYPGMDQDDAGVWTAPGGEAIAWFHDPDSNVLSLTQPAAD